MGLFSSKKPPPGPVPALSLFLASQQDQVFKPDDYVTGHVMLSTPIPLQPQAIEVSLWGRSSVWTRTESKNQATNSSDYEHYRDIVPLFSVTYNVLQPGDMIQPGQNYTFPFTFRVPRGTSINRTGGYKKDTDERWTVEPHHLPPTFFWGHKETEPDHARIFYGVTTTLVCPGVGVGKTGQDPISATAPILFQPLNPHLGAPLSVVRYPKTFTLASSMLAGQSAASIGFRQKLSDRFSSGTPKLDFELGLELPDFLSSGTEFAFRCTFTAVSKTDNVVHIPALLFRVLKVELKVITFVRAPRDKHADRFMSGSHGKKAPPVDAPTGGYSGSEENYYTEKKLVLNAVPDSKVVQLEDVMLPGEKKGMAQEDSCEVWFNARVPGTIEPSFYSFAITRRYRIKVRVVAEFGGKKFEHEAESHVRSLGSAP